MDNNEELGEESSSSDSSEESSSEEDNQQQQGDKEDSSSSSESDGDESVTEETAEVKVQERGTGSVNQPTVEESQFPSTQDLFGGDSSSESSSESEEDEINKKNENKKMISPTESGTPEPPEVSPIRDGGSPELGGSPKEEDGGGEEGGEEEEEEEEEEGGRKKEVQTVEGIFGDAADLSSSDEELSPVHENRGRRAEFGDVSDDDDAALPTMMEAGEVVEEEEAPRINVDIPRCVAEIGSEPFFVKLPNFLSVETRPFDSDLYEDEIEDDDVLDDEGRARLKLKVENTIRWRYSQDEDGNGVRESNARVVRWTDGSMSLYLGGEIFDITRQPLQGEFSHLFVRQGTGLQGQAVFRNKLTFRPHSTDSQTHRKMTLSIADRFSKAQKIRVLPVVGRDPESQRNERIKREEENLRSTVRREQQLRRTMERKKKRLTASFLEPDRNVDPEEDITAIKSSMRSRMGTGRGNKGGGRGYNSDEESSEDEDEEEDEAHKRLMRAKDNVGNSPSSNTKRQTRGNSAAATKGAGGGGGSAKKVTKSRKLVFSSDEESD